jgi:hypothetical protein
VKFKQLVADLSLDEHILPCAARRLNLIRPDQAIALVNRSPKRTAN